MSLAFCWFLPSIHSAVVQGQSNRNILLWLSRTFVLLLLRVGIVVAFYQHFGIHSGLQIFGASSYILSFRSSPTYVILSAFIPFNTGLFLFFKHSITSSTLVGAGFIVINSWSSSSKLSSLGKILQKHSIHHFLILQSEHNTH